MVFVIEIKSDSPLSEKSPLFITDLKVKKDVLKTFSSEALANIDQKLIEVLANDDEQTALQEWGYRMPLNS